MENKQSSQKEPKSLYIKKVISISKNPAVNPKNYLKEEEHNIEIQQLKQEMENMAIDFSNFKKKIEFEKDLFKRETFQFKQIIQLENNELRIDNYSLRENVEKLKKENNEMKEKIKKIQVENDESTKNLKKENNDLKEKIKKIQVENDEKFKIVNNTIINQSQTIDNQRKEIEKINAKINVITYRDSIKEVLFHLLRLSNSKLKNAKYYITYPAICKKLTNFINSDYFKKSYFIDYSQIFTKFINQIGSLIDNLNSLVHEGEKCYHYSFDGFVNSYNIYAKQYNLEEIDKTEKNIIRNNSKTFGLIKCFM